MTETSIDATQRHPISACWPDMDRQDFVKLKNDIKENGVLEPIVFYEEKVLDGWHRYKAAMETGATFAEIDYEGDDPAGFVISQNARRRHMTKSEVARCVLLTRKWMETGRPQKGCQHDTLLKKTRAEKHDKKCHVSGKTEAEMAQEAGVSVRTIRREKRKIREERGEVAPKGRTAEESEQEQDQEQEQEQDQEQEQEQDQEQEQEQDQEQEQEQDQEQEQEQKPERLSARDRWAAEREELLQRIRALEEENQELRHDLETAQIQVSAINDDGRPQLSAGVMQIAGLQNKSRGLEYKLSESTYAIADLKRQNARLRRMNTTFKRRILVYEPEHV